jgi:hypothetical protein
MASRIDGTYKAQGAEGAVTLELRNKAGKLRGVMAGVGGSYRLMGGAVEGRWVGMAVRPEEGIQVPFDAVLIEPRLTLRLKDPNSGRTQELAFERTGAPKV